MIQIFLGTPTPIALTTLEQFASTLTAINFTTAYRFLKELESEGLLQIHIWHDGERRFELRTSTSPTHTCQEHDHHHYVICNQCHTVLPIPHTISIHKLQKKIEKELGFTSLSHILEFFGTCSKCAAKCK
jgi:Fe2+ or Zn2+ uptake regulation protein